MKSVSSGDPAVADTTCSLKYSQCYPMFTTRSQTEEKHVVSSTVLYTLRAFVPNESGASLTILDLYRRGANHPCNRVKGHQASWVALFLPFRDGLCTASEMCGFLG